MTGPFKGQSLAISTAISLVLTTTLCSFLFTQDRPSLPILAMKHTPAPDFFESELRAYMAGAADVGDGVWLYQLTEKGLEASIAASGAKYYKNDSLN